MGQYIPEDISILDFSIMSTKAVGIRAVTLGAILAIVKRYRTTSNILLFSFMPVINIIAFIGFLIYYIVHCLWDPYDCDGITHVFKSKYVNKPFNFISLLISKISNFLLFNFSF